MFIQKYKSLNDIEDEFSSSLEELLKSKVPSFNFLKSQEELKADLFCLCFDDKDNSPKAYFKMKKILQEDKLTFNLITKKSKALIFNGACDEETNLSSKSRLNLRSILKSHISSLDLKGFKTFIFINDKLKDSVEKTKYLEKKVSTLIKSKKNYENYLDSLEEGFKKQVKQEFSSFKELKLNNYESLKECFSYKENIEDFKKIKKDPTFKALNNETIKFLAIESSKRVLGFSCLIKGVNKHSFYIFKNLSGLISNTVLLQLAIILFYENEDCHFLHPLISINFEKIHEDCGFSAFNLNKGTL